MFNSHSDVINCAIKYYDMIISASMDSTLRFWNWTDYICLDHVLIPDMRPKHLSLSNDCKYLLITDYMFKLRIYDIAQKKQIWVYEEFSEIKKAEWFCDCVNIMMVLEDNVKVLNLFYDFSNVAEEAANLTEE